MATKTWKIEKDLCRCCHAEGAFDNLAEPRTFLDKVEVYSDMLREFLDIDIPPVPGELCAVTYTICNACITRLRDACNFKKQVQDCEQRFMTLYYKNAIQGLKPATKVKEEIEVPIEQADSEADNIVLKKEDEDDEDDHFLGGDDDGMSDDDLPIKPPKQSVSTMKTRPKPKPKPKAPPVVKKLKPPPKPKKKEEPKPAKEKKGECKEKKFSLQPEDYRRDGENLICAHCGKSYIVKRSLTIHVKLHHYERYDCPYCEMHFGSLSPFTIHKFQVHNKDDRIDCDACEAKFFSQRALCKHQKAFHKLGKIYYCNQCEYETYNDRALLRHKVKHKPTKDLHCRFCTKSFLRRMTLQLHEKIHMNVRDKVCKVCQKAFVQKASLNYHMTKYHPEVNF